MDFGREFITSSVLGQDIEDRVIRLSPSFELIPRAEASYSESIQCHRIMRFVAEDGASPLKLNRSQYSGQIVSSVVVRYKRRVMHQP